MKTGPSSIHGTITLPSAEVAGVNRHLRDAHNAFVEKVYAAAKAWWKANKTQSFERYMDEAVVVVRRVLEKGSFHMSEKMEVAGAVKIVLKGIALRADRDGTNLRGVTWADMETEGMGRITSRTDSFARGRITFDGCDLGLHVEGNHGGVVQNWEAEAVAIALLHALDRVEWTSGSGGVVLYSDEFTRMGRTKTSEYMTFGPDGDRPRPGRPNGSAGRRPVSDLHRSTQDPQWVQW